MRHSNPTVTLDVRALDAYTFGRNTNFLAIPFAVRDEHKNVVMLVELVAGLGLLVYNLEGIAPVGYCNGIL